ncbi:MAG: FG-GAP-like repeat-containing protein [Chlorobiota bacterium]
MKLFFFLILFIPFTLLSQPNSANYYEFTPANQYGSLSNYSNVEEVSFLKPDAPGKIDKIYVALTGNQARKDTIRIIGDPSDGFYSASLWVHGILDYNLYAQFIIDYSPEKGSWYELDVSGLNLDIGGINRIGISHLIKQGGPYFLADGDGSNKGYSSWLVQTFTPNENFYNIRGTAGQINGDFLTAAKVDWSHGSESAAPPKPKFVDITNEAGLTINNGATVKAPMGAIYDWNNDGFEDINFNNHYFQNNGDGTFTNVSDDFEEVNGGYKIFGDIDNDGFTDIFVAAGNGNDKIFYGSADGFNDETDGVFGLNDYPSTTPLILDYNNDGLNDIFIARGRKTVNGQEVYYQDQLYKNLGDRMFEDVTAISGIEAGEPGSNYDCWGASIVDYNNDGFTDIFVATYRLAPDLLYKNNGDGTFTEVAKETGVVGNPTLDTRYFGHGMGSNWEDIDNNGFMDLIVGNLGHPDERGAVSNPSLIFLQDENNKFEDVHKELGLKFFEMNSGPLFADFDNDGNMDVFQSQYSYQNLNDSPRPKYSRLYMSSNVDGQIQLNDKTWELGALIHGAWAPLKFDYDLDGDMDLLICSNQENIKLLENRMENGSFLNIRVDQPENKALGYSVITQLDGKTYLMQNQGTTSTGRVSQNSNVLHLGLDQRKDAFEIIVDRNGEDAGLINLNPNTNIWINSNNELLTTTKPSIIFPINNDELSVDSYLQWKPMWNVNRVNIEIAADESFQSPIVSESIEYSNMISLIELHNEWAKGSYFWRIKAIGFTNDSEWSENGSFTLESIVTDVEISEQFDKIEVFPNPTTKYVNIKVGNDLINENLSFSIVDINGKEIRNYQNLISNNNTYNLNTEDIISGNYRIVIKKNNEILGSKHVSIVR